MLDGTTDGRPNSKLELDIVEHYISSVAHKIQVLKKKIEDMYQPAHASASAATLAEILKRILSRFFDELKSLREEIETQPVEDTLRQVQTIHLVNSAIVPALVEAMRMAYSNSPIASIVEAYQEIANLVQYGTQTIIHPTWDYNASFDEIIADLKAMTGSLGRETGQAIFSGAPLSFVIITYPIAEQEMVLRQACMAHEVGHFIYLTERLAGQLMDRPLFDEVDRMQIETSVRTQQSVENKDRLLKEANTLAGEIVSYWLREIAADFFGVCVLGPAYLLAFADVSFTQRYSIPVKLHRTHPPVQLRKEIMGGLVEEFYLAPIRSGQGHRRLEATEERVFGTVCDWIHYLVQSDLEQFTNIDSAPDIPPQVVESIYAGLKRACQRVVASLKQNYPEHPKAQKWFCTTRDVVDALELQALLSAGLTPTQLYSDAGRDPSFAAVMNSGWFHFIYARQDYQYFGSDGYEPHWDDVRDSYVSLQNLIAKAVESLQFKKEFQRRKGVSGATKQQ